MKNKVFYLISFLYGSVLMGIEMLGSRMIAPYFGSDIFVWASLIGIVLFAVAIGSFFGGRLASKKNILLIISLSSLVLLLYTSTSYKFIFDKISSWFTSSLTSYSENQSMYKDKILKPFIAIIIVFFPLILSLSMISPVLIKKLSLSVDDVGKVSGRIYAISTTGNLFGTFFTSFYLIVKFKTQTVLYTFFAVFILNILLIILFKPDKNHETL
jgi:hypothetical protein